MNKKRLLSITAIGAATLMIVITWGILIEPSDEVFETISQAILFDCEKDFSCVINSLESLSKKEDRQTVLQTLN